MAVDRPGFDPSRASPADRAGAKALALARLCVLQPLPDAVLADVDHALLAFLQAAVASVRAEAALRLSACDWAPVESVRFLAFEPIEISRPVIERSSRLSQTDLETLADLGRSQRLALARRSSVPDSLCARIAQRREFDCLYVLARNPGAVLTDIAAPDFAAVAKASDALQDALAGRSDLSAGFVRALFEAARRDVRAALQRRWPDLAGDPFDGSDFAPRSADSAAKALVDRLAARKGLSGAEMLQACRRGDMPLCDHVAARLTGLSVPDLRRALERSPVRASLLLARATALGAPDAATFYAAMCTYGRGHGLTAEALVRACEDVYSTFARDDARKALHRLGAEGSIQ